MSDFEGKTIVITGGAGVLCRTLAKAFAHEGGRIALIGRTHKTLQLVASEIVNNGGIAMPVVADVLNVKELEKAKELINAEFGTCDILINGAGGNHPSGTTYQSFFSHTNSDQTNFFDLLPDAVNQVFSLNFMGTFLPIQVFAKDMVGKHGCSILNVSSVAASKPLTKVGAYSSAKAAVTNFTQWLAVHFAKEGIRVNALAPGFFITHQNRGLLTNKDGSLTSRGEDILEHTPMGRFGEPEDLSGGALWLCGSSAQFATGIVLHIDGGFTAFSGV